MKQIKFLTNRKNRRGDLFFLSLLLVCVSLPFTKHFNSLTIGLLAFTSIISNSWKDKLENIRKNKWVWLFVAYYCMHVVALLYTENMKTGLFVLEKKSGMWVLPLILASAVQLEKQKWKQLLLVFVVVCTVGITICLFKGFYWWLFHGSDRFLSHHELSSIIGIHAVYFSVYLAFCVFILIWFLVNQAKKTSLSNRLFVAGWIGYLVLGIFLLASKTIIFTFILLGSIGYLVYIAKRKKYKGLVTYFFLLLLTLTVLYKIPKTNARFQQVFQTEFQVLNLNEYRYDTPFTGLSLRLVIWKYTPKIIAEEDSWLVGLSPGDSQDVLDEKYKAIGIYTGNPNFGDIGYLGYNTHNQFLQTLLELGIVGMLLLLGLFAVVLILSFRLQNFLFTAFLLVFLMFLLSESALEAHHGSVFFTFFTAVFILNGKQD